MRVYHRRKHNLLPGKEWRSRLFEVPELIQHVEQLFYSGLPNTDAIWPIPQGTGMSKVIVVHEH